MLIIKLSISKLKYILFFYKLFTSNEIENALWKKKLKVELILKFWFFSPEK